MTRVADLTWTVSVGVEVRVVVEADVVVPRAQELRGESGEDDCARQT